MPLPAGVKWKWVSIFGIFFVWIFFRLVSGLNFVWPNQNWPVISSVNFEFSTWPNVAAHRGSITFPIADVLLLRVHFLLFLLPLLLFFLPPILQFLFENSLTKSTKVTPQIQIVELPIFSRGFSRFSASFITNCANSEVQPLHELILPAQHLPVASACLFVCKRCFCSKCELTFTCKWSICISQNRIQWSLAVLVSPTCWRSLWHSKLSLWIVDNSVIFRSLVGSRANIQEETNVEFENLYAGRGKQLIGCLFHWICCGTLLAVADNSR